MFQLGKSVVATRDLQAGNEITEEDVVAKVSEPPGLPAQMQTEVIGRTLLVDVARDRPLQHDHLL